MDYEKFVEKIKEEVRKALPDELKDVTFSVETIRKSTGEYERLIMKDEALTGKPVPIFNLTGMYFSLVDGTPMEALSDFIKNYIKRALDKEHGFHYTFNAFEKYDNVKDKLTFKICHAERRASFLETVPYTQVSDLAVTYFIEIADNGVDTAGFTVTNELLETYGISKEQLHEDALKAMAKTDPPKLYSMAEMFKKTHPDFKELTNLFECDISLQDKEMMLILTNSSRVNGSAVIVNPNVLEIAADYIGGNYTVIPSSIHELILVPESHETELEVLREIIEDGNSHFVSPEDLLSYEPYHYDAKEKKFELLEEYLDRTIKSAKQQPKFTPALFSESAENKAEKRFSYSKESDKSLN